MKTICQILVKYYNTHYKETNHSTNISSLFHVPLDLLKYFAAHNPTENSNYKLLVFGLLLFVVWGTVGLCRFKFTVLRLCRFILVNLVEFL